VLRSRGRHRTRQSRERVAVNWYQQEASSSKRSCVCGNTPAVSCVPAVCADYPSDIMMADGFFTYGFICVLRTCLAARSASYSRGPELDLWPASFLTEMFVLYTSPCKNTIWEKNGKFVSVLKKHPTPRRVTECRGWLVNTPASYSGGSGFKSQHENRQKWLRSLWFFSVPPGKCWDRTLL
jgi:hypothetical protein